MGAPAQVETQWISPPAGLFAVPSRPSRTRQKALLTGSGEGSHGWTWKRAGAEAQAERKALIERHSEDPRRRSRRMRANGRAISPSIWDGSSARRRATLPGANAPGANSSNGAAAAVGRQSRMDALLIVSASLY